MGIQFIGTNITACILLLGMQYNSLPAIQVEGIVSKSRTNRYDLEVSQLPDPNTPPDNRTQVGGDLGGSAQACADTTIPLKALTPTNDRGTFQRTTANPRPTSWFYIPYTSADVKSIEFKLQDSNDDDIYRAFFEISIPGIVSVQLPSEVELAEDAYYHWYLVLDCSSDDDSEPNTVLNGWIQRISTNSESSWYDKLTNLAERYLASPQDETLRNEWMNLLSEADLSQWSQVPFGSMRRIER